MKEEKNEIAGNNSTGMIAKKNPEDMKSGRQDIGLLPCMVNGTAERGIKKEAAYTFIPLNAVTTAAPPRMSIAVTMTGGKKARSVSANHRMLISGKHFIDLRIVMSTKIM